MCDVVIQHAIVTTHSLTLLLLLLLLLLLGVGAGAAFAHDLQSSPLALCCFFKALHTSGHAVSPFWCWYQEVLVPGRCWYPLLLNR